jgi:hypothetical protein
VDERERQIVRLFVEPARQERVEFLLSKPKRRFNGIHEFHTSQILNPKCLVEIPGNQQYAPQIYSRMRELGAGDRCYVVSANDDFDASEIRLADALEQCVGFCVETILISSEGNVGYFEGGHAKDRYILRPPRGRAA